LDEFGIFVGEELLLGGVAELFLMAINFCLNSAALCGGSGTGCIEAGEDAPCWPMIPGCDGEYC